MAKAYFVGGAPRSGKTTVIQRLIAERPMLAASTDAIRSVAKGLITPEDNPKLFKVERGAFGSEANVRRMLENPEQSLAYELGEYEETWKSVLDFVAYNLKDGKDVAIEGVAIMPHNLHDLPFEYRAVFVVNLDDQTDRILEQAHGHPEDWLHKYDDDTIKAFCHFNKLQNEYYHREANEYATAIVAVNDNDFNASLGQAVSTLLDSDL